MQLPPLQKKKGLISSSRVGSSSELSKQDLPRLRKLDPIKKPVRLNKDLSMNARPRLQPINKPMLEQLSSSNSILPVSIENANFKDVSNIIPVKGLEKSTSK